MGLRINTAIGWGMPIDDFNRLCMIPGLSSATGDAWSGTLQTALANTGNMKPPSWPLPTTGPDDTCFDLISLIGYDDATDILLYPCIDEARRWHRRDDDIDYALIWGPRGRDDHDTPDNLVEYLNTGLHPYGDLRMHPDGTEAAPPLGDEARRQWDRDPALLPGVPRSLRHWATTAGLLDLTGIAALRPMRATWWA